MLERECNDFESDDQDHEQMACGTCGVSISETFPELPNEPVCLCETCYIDAGGRTKCRRIAETVGYVGSLDTSVVPLHMQCCDISQVILDDGERVFVTHGLNMTEDEVHKVGSDKQHDPPFVEAVYRSSESGMRDIRHFGPLDRGDVYELVIHVEAMVRMESLIVYNRPWRERGHPQEQARRDEGFTWQGGALQQQECLVHPQRHSISKIIDDMLIANGERIFVDGSWRGANAEWLAND